MTFTNGTYLKGNFKGTVMLSGEGSISNVIGIKPVIGKF